MNIDKIRSRSQIIKLIRAWFDEQGFSEIHTPRLVALPGQEPHLEPFWTSLREGFNGRSSDIALITSPEYAMKRLLAEGMDKIYDLGPCFRNNEPWDGTHDPEFLLLEWYRRASDLDDLMNDAEAMVMYVAKEYRAMPPVLTRIWQRMTVEQAFREYLKIELSPLLGDLEAIKKTALSLEQNVAETDSWDDVFFKIFLTHIEPKLGIEQPTFLYRYPASMAGLSRKCVDDPRYAERVELYIGGLELANGFAELADPEEQRARFEADRALRQAQGKKTWPIDEKLLSSLPKMGNAVGMAFGADRLAMLLTGSKSINDILPFPARERFNRVDES